MKTLKKLESGLIAYTDFGADGSLTAPFRVEANYERRDGQFFINGGSVLFDAFSIGNFVLDVGNNYVPTNTADMGGICITRNGEKKELFEYYNGTETAQFPHIRLVRNGDVYTGYGSEDAKLWTDKGYVFFPYAETVGITLVGSSPYPIKTVKLYKSREVSFLSMSPNWKIVFKEGDVVVAQTTVISNVGYITLPNYPFQGRIIVYDENDTVISSDDMEAVWGGDEYMCSVNVDLYTLDNIPLADDGVKHLGNLQNGEIVGCYKAVNNNSDPVTATIRVADYSAFYDWTELSLDYGLAPGAYSSEITLTINGNGQELFWLRVARPPSFNLVGFNFKKTECTFFLEVV